MRKIDFIDTNGSLHCDNPDVMNGLYFPIASEKGLKSAITPTLLGDAKTDQNHFLMEPVSIENLHNNRSGRNFWCVMKDKSLWSATGASLQQRADCFTDKKEDMHLDAGFMWHRVSRQSFSFPLQATITSFVPYEHNAEVMQVALKNIGKEKLTFTPVAAIPMYGRSADNIRDHRHVTSLLTRARVVEKGVIIKPTLSFDERGHQVNDTTYYVLGQTENGETPEKFYADVDSFIGASGNLEYPADLVKMENAIEAGSLVDGKEPFGGLVFKTITLEPGEEQEYTVFTGVAENEKEYEEIVKLLHNKEAVYKSLEDTKEYWKKKINASFATGDNNFDMFMKWVSFQPELRRIYGCSFLPHHDYGRGGRGWRDLWQDCLALLLMNPREVRTLLLSNFAGVRIDGSNATIIGEKQGEFKADRNSITRVWMDHGVWPFMTILLYLNQTGDFGFLYEQAPYFKDRQVMRGKAVDELWNGKDTFLYTDKGTLYEGTVLEHLLLQNLCAFWEVGEHNHILLRDADWNDAIDMAGERGESVAFTNAYGKNLIDLAEVIEKEAEKGVTEVSLLKEMEILLQEDHTDDPKAKRAVLHSYMECCNHNVSGERIVVDAKELARNLKQKGQWILNHIRDNEWVTDEKGNGWFNGYYDNSGNRVEGVINKQVRMMLTGQVFSIMAGTATKSQIASIVRSANAYLLDENCGGYRLNTDFEEVKTDMGRMFGFAYGEKENGAVFSHMAVMFANALYKRGFVKEGYRSLELLYKQSMNFEKSRIYPGIPEYFGAGGRGLYHYLTGAASWYLLTVITQMFGIRGEDGNLVAEPKLLASQFDETGKCGLQLTFMERNWKVEYYNPTKTEFGSGLIDSVYLNQKDITKEALVTIKDTKLIISKELVEQLETDKSHHLLIHIKSIPTE